MGTTLEKVQAAVSSKAAIKSAIEAKGVSVGDAKLSEYAGKIEEIGGGLSYTTGTVTLASTQTLITIPYASTTGKVTVYLVHQSPTYGVNGVVGFFGTNYFFDDLTINNMIDKVFGVIETRTTYNGYANTFFGYNFPFNINENSIEVGVRNASYPYQAGTYDYLIIENQ